MAAAGDQMFHCSVCDIRQALHQMPQAVGRRLRFCLNQGPPSKCEDCCTCDIWLIKAIELNVAVYLVADDRVFRQTLAEFT